MSSVSLSYENSSPSYESSSSDVGVDVSNITKTSIYLTKFNNIVAYIPVFSTVASVIDLGQKLFLHLKGEEVTKISAYHEYIQEKSKVRCVVLLVPVLGNIAIALYDGLNAAMGKYYAYQAGKTTDDGEELNYLLKGAAKGNQACFIQLEYCYYFEKDYNKSFEYAKKAARLGNGKGLYELSRYKEFAQSEKERLEGLSRYFG